MISSVLHWSIDPYALQLTDTIGIRYYSLLFGFGIFLSGYFLTKVLESDKRYHSIPVESLAIYLIAGIVIGARLGHCLFYDPSYFLEHPVEMLLPIQQQPDGSWIFTGFLGLASHGGIIGMLIALAILSIRKNISSISLLDLIALVAPLAGCFIRVGNFFNSEIIGEPTDQSWGVVFTAVDDLARHPSQLYEAIAYLIIFLVMYSRRWELLQYQGKIFGWVLTLVFIGRFLIEFTKIDQVSWEAGMELNMGQILSLPFVIVGIAFIYFWKKKDSV